MKNNKKRNSGVGVGIGAAIGLAISFAFESKNGNSGQFQALGLPLGAKFGAVLDILRSTKNQ